MLAAYTVAGIIAAISGRPRNAPPPSAWAVLFSILFSSGVFSLSAWLSFFHSSRGVALPGDSAAEKAPSVRYGWWKAFWTGAAVMAAALPVIGLISAGAEYLFSYLGIEAPQQDAVKWLSSPDTPRNVKLILLAGVVFAAPLSEEYFFRYTLFRILRARSASVYAPSLAVAALFAGIHLSVIAFIPVFCLSLVFSELMRRTGRFAAPFAAHMVFNTASALLALYAK